MEFYLTLEPVLNGDVDEKNSEKGIENRGFDLKAVDKMHKSAIEKGSGQNHPGGDADSSLSDIKRSQSISSLSEEIPTYESPKPITRRKNKSVAPVPPIFKDDKKKEGARVVKENSQFVKMKEQHLISDRPDKPPRPLVTSNSTLPRPSKNNRENKSTETNAEDMMLQSTDDMVILRKPLDECVEKPIRKDLVRRTTTISTNTDSVKEFKDGYPTNSLERRSERPVAAPRTVSMTVEMSDKLKAESESKPIEYSKVNLISVKKEWLLGKDSADIESIQLRKPAVPERPSTLKPHNFKLNRSFMDVTLRNNYENVSLSSNENLSTGSLDDKTLQKTQMYSIEKQQVAIIDVGNQDKVKTDKNLECTPKEVLNNGKDEVEKNLPEKTGDGDRDNDCNEAVASTNERKISGSRPVSLPGTCSITW